MCNIFILAFSFYSKFKVANVLAMLLIKAEAII